MQKFTWKKFKHSNLKKLKRKENKMLDPKLLPLPLSSIVIKLYVIISTNEVLLRMYCRNYSNTIIHQQHAGDAIYLKQKSSGTKEWLVIWVGLLKGVEKKRQDDQRIDLQ